MVHQITILVAILISNARAKPARNETDAEIQIFTEDSKPNDTNLVEINEAIIEDYFYNTTSLDKTVLPTKNTAANEADIIVTKKSCEISNNTNIEEDNVSENMLDSIYLNNIYSRVTTILIDENVSIRDIEINGVNLFDVVNSDCGGARVCPRLRVNWTEDKTIMIGFLGAYGRSQVRTKIIIFLSLQ